MIERDVPLLASMALCLVMLLALVRSDDARDDALNALHESQLRARVAVTATIHLDPLGTCSSTFLQLYPALAEITREECERFGLGIRQTEGT